MQCIGIISETQGSITHLWLPDEKTSGMTRDGSYDFKSLTGPTTASARTFDIYLP